MSYYLREIIVRLHAQKGKHLGMLHTPCIRVVLSILNLFRKWEKWLLTFYSQTLIRYAKPESSQIKYPLGLRRRRNVLDWMFSWCCVYSVKPTQKSYHSLFKNVRLFFPTLLSHTSPSCYLHLSPPPWPKKLNQGRQIQVCTFIGCKYSINFQRISAERGNAFRFSDLVWLDISSTELTVH